MQSLNRLIGAIPGRLYVIATTLAAFLGAVSGSAMASVAMLGRFVYPTMIERGCDRRLSIGTILAGATLDPDHSAERAGDHPGDAREHLDRKLSRRRYHAWACCSRACSRSMRWRGRCSIPRSTRAVDPRPPSERGWWPLLLDPADSAAVLHHFSGARPDHSRRRTTDRSRRRRHHRHRADVGVHAHDLVAGDLPAPATARRSPRRRSSSSSPAPSCSASSWPSPAPRPD